MGAIGLKKNFADMFSRFATVPVPECRGETDERTSQCQYRVWIQEWMRIRNKN